MGKNTTTRSKIGTGRHYLENMVFYSVVVGVVSCSAALPFYVHSHQDRFGPPVIVFSGAKEKLEADEQFTQNYRRQTIVLLKPRLQLDKIITGAIAKPDSSGRKMKRQIPASQPFPADVRPATTALEIMFVSSGQMLAVDQGQVVSLKIGDALHDGSLIQSITRAGRGWEVRTSSGKLMSWTNGQSQ